MADDSTIHLDEFDKEFRDESDRAAVILAAARLDEMLHLALTKKLLTCPDPQDNLLRTDGPIGAFSSRIILAHRLGLIDNDFAKTLHLIRRIRNDFAHESAGAKLSSGSHSDRVRALFLPFKIFFEAKVKTSPIFQEFEKRGLRGKFELVCYYCMVELQQTTELTIPLEKPKHEFLEWAKSI